MHRKSTMVSYQKTIVLIWCEGRDLNPYGCPHAPQTCASANSATSRSTKLLYTIVQIVKGVWAVFCKGRSGGVKVVRLRAATRAETASEGMRQSPRGESVTVPTLGRPAGRNA